MVKNSKKGVGTPETPDRRDFKGRRYTKRQGRLKRKARNGDDTQTRYEVVCALASTIPKSWKVKKQRSNLRNIIEESIGVRPEISKLAEENNVKPLETPAPQTPDHVLAPRRAKLKIRRKPKAPPQNVLQAMSLSTKSSEMETEPCEDKRVVYDAEMINMIYQTNKIECPENVIVYQRRAKLKEVAIPEKSDLRAKKKLKYKSSVRDTSQGSKGKVKEEKSKRVLVKWKHPRIRKQKTKLRMSKKNKMLSDNGILVPYQENSHRKPRAQTIAKVDLDERTVREWKILIGELDSDDADEGERGRWEQERNLFNERVKLFVSNMRLIQGERKFSQWKGSVIDSVVGAFLSQNVNDTLSSFAFMSLTAKFAHGATREKSLLENSEGSSTTVRDGEVSSCFSTFKTKKRKLRSTIGISGTSEKTRAKQENHPINWENLKKLYAKDESREKTSETSDALDWDGVRNANVDHIAKAIEMRGMNNNLAARIKNCLNFLEKELGCVDLEWIRDVPPCKAKEYLLSLPGLGLKSVECIRLLTLMQHAFPIDRNAGRVAVRLGWVPLLPLLQGEEFHNLKKYPHMNSIQTYLWPRLCTLDVSTLYELHCQMITFGKVFCTKRNPNCNACPMRAECKYYASSLASSQLALPGKPKRTRRKSAGNLIEKDEKAASSETGLVPFHEADCVSPVSILEPDSESEDYASNCLRMVEVAESQTECLQMVEDTGCGPIGQNISLEWDIEDFGLVEIPRITVDVEKLRKNVHKVITERNIPIQEGETSKDLMVLTSEISPITMPKLKDIKHLRTEHLVYVLPDSHHLLSKLEKREPNDPSPYLLAIWTQENLDKSEFAPDEDSVYGTLLIPARTAIGGRFPFNGTFFQANEVLADDESSEVPIKIPRSSIWNLPRATLYCGNNISAVCRAMGTCEVQKCFWRGYVCFRGFNRKTKEPKLLSPRFHLPLSKAYTKRKERGEANNNRTF